MPYIVFSYGAIYRLGYLLHHKINLHKFAFNLTHLTIDTLPHKKLTFKNNQVIQYHKNFNDLKGDASM